MHTRSPSNSLQAGGTQSRRDFISKLGRAAAATTAASALSVAPALTGLPGSAAGAADLIAFHDAAHSIQPRSVSTARATRI